jgi:hypothetical protein
LIAWRCSSSFQGLFEASSACHKSLHSFNEMKILLHVFLKKMFSSEWRVSAKIISGLLSRRRWVGFGALKGACSIYQIVGHWHNYPDILSVGNQSVHAVALCDFFWLQWETNRPWM